MGKCRTLIVTRSAPTAEAPEAIVLVGTGAGQQLETGELAGDHRFVRTDKRFQQCRRRAVPAQVVHGRVTGTVSLPTVRS